MLSASVSTPHPGMALLPMHSDGDSHWSSQWDSELDSQLSSLDSRSDMREFEGPSVDDVLLITHRNGRICPTSVHWWRIFESLPDRPAKLKRPLEGREWITTGTLGKRMALREQVEWAASVGALGLLRDKLAALPEAAWHHRGE
ncbi:MAG TPA: hypothetical protein VHA82_10540 [Ramlibacter sp.]|uniref:hypothetical protein n=1 Tax=Ramlibacter sp. TaxID=1917967 RepID=UPI002BF1CEBA|nr:hypothetical protein [Ramlibacter sp.]HVZ44235.1 hypothetical protein [Ramlibacter sp.]